MTSPIGYAVYIDEAGDDGLKTVEPVDERGASEWFVLGAFVVPIHEDRSVQQWLNEGLRQLNSPQRGDIHFAKLDDVRKEKICAYLATLNFRWFAAISHKPNMRAYRNVKAEKVQAKNYFYNWMSRILLEKVTQYCSKDSKIRFPGDIQHKLRIEFSKRGGMVYPHTRNYLAKLWMQSKSGNIYQTNDNLSWDVVDIDQIKHFSHRERAGLQLADVVTSAIYRGLAPTNGRAADTRFAKLLAPRIAAGPNGVFGFGLKLLPDQWQQTLKDHQRELFEIFGAPESGRLPDPSATGREQATRRG